MSEHEEARKHLKRYRDIQRAEGLTIEAERHLAQLQGEAWRDYIAACRADGVEPESMDLPGWTW
jgi:hypothetical protein